VHGTAPGGPRGGGAISRHEPRRSGTYETIADLEREAAERLGEITGLADPASYVTSGGTEANIQAVRIARNRASDATDDPNVVAPEHVLLVSEGRGDARRRVANGTGHGPPGRRRRDGGTRRRRHGRPRRCRRIDECGFVDPIPAIADLAADAGVLCHVDAAWGGFYLPFTDHEWGFDHAAVDTLTIDPHKVGQAAVPAGGLIARSTDLLDELAIDTPYLESTSQVTLTGTRSGAGVASAVAAMDALWPRATASNTSAR